MENKHNQKKKKKTMSKVFVWIMVIMMTSSIFASLLSILPAL